ncbi:MAG TPA: membrane dipeptidase [Steroidobacteraceae bacterium]|nr:membrane dipeptidase [Steroidobacteraceae bacterium]
MTGSRRHFLLLAGAAALRPRLGPARMAGALPHDAVIINALGGLDDPNHPDTGPAVITPRMLADAHASGEAAVNVTLGYVSGPERDPYAFTLADVAHWDGLVSAHPADLLKVLSVADIYKAKREGKVGLIYGFQNAAMMGNDASQVDVFAAKGVKVIQLTYNPANQLGGGSMAAETIGLTAFGREVIDRLNSRRVMVDLSHSGRQTCLDAARYSKQPISINHTGCRALVDLPRNKTDQELRRAADGGGFIGIYFMPFLNPSGHARAADVVAHIEHALSVCGEDHVGIGTDGGTTPVDDLQAYAADLKKEHERRVAQGVAAPGERVDTHPFVDDLRGPDQFRKLALLLAARGHSGTRITKILGGNFIRYAREIWGA